MKKLGILLLALLMLMLLLPGAVAETATTVRIGSVWLTEGQYLANEGTEPTTTQPQYSYAHFSNGVLTLSGFDFHNYEQSGSTPGVIYADGDLKIELYNSTEVVSAGIADGYTGVTASLYVTGNLTIESQEYSYVYFHNSQDTGASTRYGIYAGGTLDIKGDGTISASAGTTTAGGSIGIFSKGDMTLACNRVNAVGGDAGTTDGRYSYGISAPNLTITSGEVNAYAGTAATSVGISVNHASVVPSYTEGELRISGTSTVVTATGGDGSGVSVGISIGDLVQVDGGTVTATGGNAYRISRGIGYNSYNKLVVNGGQVAAMGGYSSNNTSCGYQGSAVTQTGGELLLAGDAYADNGYAVSNSPNITVSGGTFIAAGGKYALNTLPNVNSYTDHGVWVSTEFADENPGVYDGTSALTGYKQLKIGKAEFVNVYVHADYDRRGTVTGDGRYMKGSFVTVKATPINNSRFKNWTKNTTYGTALSTNDTYTFKAESDIVLYANFNPAMYRVSLTNARFPGDPNVTYDSFEVATNVTVYANSRLSEGYIFDHWEVTGITLTGSQKTYSTLDFLMPANQVTITAIYKDANDHSHAPCGDATCTDSSHPTHNKVDYKPLNLNDTLTLQNGNNYYYLSTDIYPKDTIYIRTGQTLYLCLHGNDVSANLRYASSSIFHVDGGKLILCDCKGGGLITTNYTGQGGKGRGMYVTGTVEMYGGNITSNIVGTATTYEDGAGVYVERDGVFTMYDGAITNNKTGNTSRYGGGVYVKDTGKFIMHGGEISGNTAGNGAAIASWCYSPYPTEPRVTITGGTISGNKAKEAGGGVYMFRNHPSDVKDMVMTGGAITGNTAGMGGGGVEIDHARFEITGGTISNNTASGVGGGIYNYCSILDLGSATITGNKASQGGGIYFGYSSSYNNHIYVSGGAVVTGNTDTNNKANNVYLPSGTSLPNDNRLPGALLEVTAPLTGDLHVYTQDTPSTNAPVRYLKSTTSHTVDEADLAHTTSDRTGEYFIKNIDRENYGIFGKVQYAVTVTKDGSGTASASLTLAEPGTVITLSATPDEGYAFKEWQVVKGGVNVADNKFPMGSADVEIKAVFEALHTCSNPALTAGKAANCTEDGWMSYYTCSCGKLYEDEDCATEIPDLDVWKAGDGKVPAGHAYGDLIPAVEAVHTQTELKAPVAAHYFCDVCDTYFTEDKAETTLEALSGDMPAHDQSGWVNTDPAQHWNKCSVCGLEHNNKADHVFDDELDALCNTCGYTRAIHQHTFEEKWSYDETDHWHAPTCGHDVTSGKETHHGGTATCTAQAVCEDCGQPYGEKAEHAYGDLIPAEEAVHTQTELKAPVAAHYFCDVCDTYFTEDKAATTLEALSGDAPVHSYGEWVITDMTNHWKECSCGLKSEEGVHVFDDDQDAQCDTCGYIRTIHQHTFEEKWSYDETDHWHAPTCGHDVTSGKETHHGGTATCTAQAVCEDCGQPYGEKADHAYGDLIPAEEAIHSQTELKAPVAAHYFCDVCDTYFTEDKAETTLEALSGEEPVHSYGEWVTTDMTNHWKECSCGLKSEEGGHIFDDDQDAQCDTCGYVRTVAPKTYTVTVTTDGNGTASAFPVSGVSGTEVTLDLIPDEGYRFVAWHVVRGNVNIGTDHKFIINSDDVEIEAIFEEIPGTTYTVTITTQGNGTVTADPSTSTADTQVILTITPADGWTLDKLEVGSTDVTEHVSNHQFQFSMPESDITVNAIFKELPPVTYSVTVVNGEGDGHYEAGATVTVTADVPAEGKRFSGWTSDDVTFADASAATTTFVMSAKAVTVTANYEDIPPTTYTVTVTTDGNGTASASPVSGVTGTEITLTAIPAEGYAFKEWQVISGNVTITDNHFQIGTENVAVKAIFEAIPVQPDPEPVTSTVTFLANGGQGSMQPQVFAEGEAKALFANTFTREGYTFDGWNTEADGSGTAFQNGETVTVTGDVTLYAQWKAAQAPGEPEPDPKPETNPLVIIRHPEDQIVAPGETADFSVLASGDGLTYQWYINRNDGRGWVKLPGATSYVHHTDAADKAFDGFQYACQVQDAHGNTVRSGVATLYVTVQPDIPATGDGTNLALLCAILFISCAGGFLLRRRILN